MTHVSFVLDRSGSMYQCLTDTIGGFNCFIENQKKDNENGLMSLYFFNNSYSTIYQKKTIGDVEELTTQVYRPSGGTALLDSIGTTITNVAKETHTTPPTIVILTDGYENSSTVYTQSHINDLIKLYKEKDNWNFVFLAANQDAIQVGKQMGISEESAMTFSPDTVKQAFEGLSSALGRQQTGEDDHVTFSGLERAASQPATSSEVFTGEEYQFPPNQEGLGRC